jgi:hypothetical protein
MAFRAIGLDAAERMKVDFHPGVTTFAQVLVNRHIYHPDLMIVTHVI